LCFRHAAIKAELSTLHKEELLTLRLHPRIDRLTVDAKSDITATGFSKGSTLSPFVRIYSSCLIGSCLAHS
jgi:hypothetical protein